LAHVEHGPCRNQIHKHQRPGSTVQTLARPPSGNIRAKQSIRQVGPISTLGQAPARRTEKIITVWVKHRNVDHFNTKYTKRSRQFARHQPGPNLPIRGSSCRVALGSLRDIRASRPDRMKNENVFSVLKSASKESAPKPNSSDPP